MHCYRCSRRHTVIKTIFVSIEIYREYDHVLFLVGKDGHILWAYIPRPIRIYSFSRSCYVNIDRQNGIGYPVLNTKLYINDKSIKTVQGIYLYALHHPLQVRKFFLSNDHEARYPHLSFKYVFLKNDPNIPISKGD